MNEEAKLKFDELVKDAVENTDFDKNFNTRLEEAGLFEIPEFEFLKDAERTRNRKTTQKARNSRLRKIAGFVLAVFVVSTAMNIIENSEFALAGKFRLNNLMFSIKNGISASDIQFSKTILGMELIIRNEEQIPIAKDYLSELRIPSSIPEGFQFTNLHIKNDPRNEYKVVYSYENTSNETIVIKQEKLGDFNWNFNIYGIKNDFYTENMRVLYISDTMSNYNSICAFTEFEMIEISGQFKHEELMGIFEMFN